MIGARIGLLFTFGFPVLLVLFLYSGLSWSSDDTNTSAPPLSVAAKAIVRWIGLGASPDFVSADAIKSIHPQSITSAETLLSAGGFTDTPIWPFQIDSIDLRPPLARMRELSGIPMRSFRVLVNPASGIPLLATAVNPNLDHITTDPNWPLDKWLRSVKWSIHESIPKIPLIEALHAASPGAPMSARRITCALMEISEQPDSSRVVWFIATDSIPFQKLGELGTLTDSLGYPLNLGIAAQHPSKAETYYGTCICIIDASTGAIISSEISQ